MSLNDTTFPLSSPSWTWDQASGSVSDAPDDSAQQTKAHGRKCVSSVPELPSRRWLVQASRKL
ncbi:MAG: hypothetical protein QGH94_01980 [Phycisphaerae bacterium]|jgi:hypothetical protein|nr:hypothetical protein [Phycisphaerae bacterium]MDP7286742.1 hypothetical protein [Phycisphaerae bacterium]